MHTQYGPITLRQHAVNDAVALLFVLVSPWLLGYTQHVGATQYAVALFFIGMGLNVVTDYPLGVVKKLPIKWHKLVELTSPGIFIVVPWVFFADAGAMPWAATVAGVAVVLNATLTRERPAPESPAGS
jgi:hypothetical protein